MKDIHGERAVPGRIPLISPALHCVAMTALVWLRTSFGYTMFRPRSILISFAVLVAAVDYIAWHEPDIWRQYRAVCLFGGGAVALYFVHFGITFVREFGRERDRERDDYSGTSHAFRVLRIFGLSEAAPERNAQLWAEPVAVLLFAAVLRALGEPHLSAWLVIVAGCMFAKEWLNYWAEVRRGNIAKDIEDEARKRGEARGGQPAPEARQATRTAAEDTPRNVVLTEEEARAVRFAKVLGITVPYDLDEAETNFRERIQLNHPDTHGTSPENHERSLELNEAIEFFRKTLAA